METPWWGQQPPQGELKQLRLNLTKFPCRGSKRTTEARSSFKPSSVLNQKHEDQLRIQASSEPCVWQCLRPPPSSRTDGLHSCRPAWGSGESQECAELGALRQLPLSRHKNSPEVSFICSVHTFTPWLSSSVFKPPTTRHTVRPPPTELKLLTETSTNN